MLFNRWKRAKNKKGITLVEMIAAIAITAILASVLSMMIVPVMNTYRTSSTRAELQTAVTARLNDIALWLRSATGVYVPKSKDSSGKVTGYGSFPDCNKNNLYQFQAVRNFDIKWGIANMNCYGSSGYNYPELKWVQYSETDTKNHTLKWASEHKPSMKLDSDIYQSQDFTCPSITDFYFYIRQNPDDGNRRNVMEFHLKVKKGNVEYEGTKTFVCENLAINNLDIYLASFNRNGTTGVWDAFTKAEVSTGSDASKWTKYYSVWFSRDV